MKTLTLLIFVCLTYFIGVAQPNDFSSIVRIVALNEYGENDIGTGILVGNDKTHLYITTANHVVKTAKDVKVFFHNQSTAQTATVIQKDEKMDVAVLKMKLSNGQPLPHLLAADPKILEVQKKVLSIGHPGGSFWKSNYQNIIQEVSIYNQPEVMSITPQGIIPGCSGSIVLTYEGIWLGMITETTSVEAKCVKSDAITKKIKSWNIPINLTIPEEPEMVRIDQGVYKGKTISEFSMGKYEVTYEDFRLFVAATEYITDAEKEGFSWTFYNFNEAMSMAMAIGEIAIIHIGQTDVKKVPSSYIVPSFLAVSDNSNKFKLKYLNQGNWTKDWIGKIRNQNRINHPVYHVSFQDAQAYCTWLSGVHQKEFRLPRVKEWEYTASFFGTIDTIFYQNIQPHANLRDSSFNKIMPWFTNDDFTDGFPTTSPVDAMIPENTNLSQLHGNVSEWCVDEEGNAIQAGGNYYETIGTWRDIAYYSNGIVPKLNLLEFQTKQDSTFRSSVLGFRVVKVE